MKNISVLIMDVDGTLTDGGIYYDSYGNELKKFSVKDGAGFALARSAGIRLVVLTGRECQATYRRMSELHADVIAQNVADKAAWLKQYFEEYHINGETAAYIGDDLNDLEAMNLCGLTGCPADASRQIKDIVDYQTVHNGGCGAVREFVEYILDKTGKPDF